MVDAVIVSTARTPIGRAVRGVFNLTHGADMGGHVIQHAVKRAGIEPGDVEDVTMGSVDHPGMRAGRGSSTWESDNFAVAPYTAELSVSVNVGSVHIDPAGGCQ